MCIAHAKTIPSPLLFVIFHLHNLYKFCLILVILYLRNEECYIPAARVKQGISILLQESDIPSSNKYTSFKPAMFICSTRKSILVTFISLNNAASLNPSLSP